MYEHPKHVRGAQQAYPQHNSPLVHENVGIEGTNVDKENPGRGNLQPLSSGDDDPDETQVNSDVIAAWTQRLQVLTVVTTFLTSMDGELFSLAALNTQIGLPTGTTSRELVYSCLSGALIFHVCACILGYVASFALIRYRIMDASGEDDTKVPGMLLSEPVHPLRWLVTFLQRPEIFRFLPFFRSSRSPPPPPLSLLTHCYYTTLCLTTVGFCLALTGILAYIWAGLPTPVGIFSTICLGVGISAGVWAVAM